MTTKYSAHPALASEQLQRAEHATNNSNIAHTHQHRRHNSADTAASSSGSGGGGILHSPSLASSPTKSKSSSKSAKSTSSSTTTTAAATKILGSTDVTLPVRTNNYNDVDVDFVDANHHHHHHSRDNDDTKDCVDCALPVSPNTIDETDHTYLQHRFSRIQHTVDSSRRPQHNRTNSTDTCITDTTHAGSDGYTSGLSSAISSPSPSTVSSPLSTPTRHSPHFQHSHQHCCQKSSATATSSSLALAGSAGVTSSTHQHIHHTHAHHHHSSAAGGCKKLQKFDPRLGPSPYRQLLPIALCILSFATVFSILIVYMDTTEIRHQQFRLNMSRDYELYGVAQDDPQLIAFLREIHMRKYPMHFLKNRETPVGAATAALNFSAHHDELTPEMAHYVADLVGGKMNGAVIQSLPGALGQLMTAPWLAETLNWAGVIVEPEPRRYFTLRKQNAHRAHMQVVHACVSPNPYPKEVTIHNEDAEVRINSLLDEETSWFNSRVKCFPLYTIMLACNRVEYDLLSLGVYWHELEILQTLPFDKVKIEVISIHLPDDHDESSGGNSSSVVRAYIQSITKFLMGKSYKLQKRFGRNYFYQRINTTSRTRKRDILLLKTP